MKKNVLKQVIYIISYSIAIGAGLLFGILYLTNPDLLGYHMNAIGISSMNDMSESYQIMFRTFKRAAGLGMLSNAVSLIILLIIHINKNKVWTAIILFIAAFPYWISLFLNVYNLETATNAGAPMIPNLIVAFMTILGFIISLPNKKGKSDKQ